MALTEDQKDSMAKVRFRFNRLVRWYKKRNGPVSLLEDT